MHDITRYLTIFTISNTYAKTPRDKLFYLIYKKLCFGRAFGFVGLLFTFRENYGIIVLLRYLIDKLEFDGEEP